MDPAEYFALFGLPPDNNILQNRFTTTATPEAPVETPAPGPQPAIQVVIPPSVPPGTQLSVPPGGKVGDATSQGASFRGVTDQGLEQSKKVYSGVDGRIAQQTAPLETQARDQLGQQRANAQNIYDAQNEQARLTQTHGETLAGLKRDEALFHQDAAALEQRMRLETKAESERYVGAYREQLAAVRAMTVDPTGPIAKLSTAQAGGLSMAMFAQGFLAAQGIQIDVSGQLDRWVERSIHEQERQIKQAEKGAEDTLSLWNIARQSSADDLEARTRYRGMVVAGMMATTEAKAQQFNSSVAMSKAKEANARLAVELGAVERQIQDGYFNKVQTVKQAEYQRAYQMGSLAQQSKQTNETRRHNEAMEGISRAAKLGEGPL
ncbi:MAG: hypothetical protein H0W42_11325, partial [Gemmatimonadaceae bacterium]|nr:hypothetical protein [Gemmatimonadaceae bacterium]